MADFGEWHNRKARKAHRCELCWRTIDPGETYLAYQGRWDGAWCSVKHCAHCSAAVLFHDIDTWGEGVGPDDMCEWEPRNLRELRDKVYYLRRWRRPDGGLYPVPVNEADHG